MTRHKKSGVVPGDMIEPRRCGRFARRSPGSSTCFRFCVHSLVLCVCVCVYGLLSKSWNKISPAFLPSVKNRFRSESALAVSCEDCTRHDHASSFTQAWPTQTMLRQRGDYTTRRARCAACRQHAAAAASAAAQSCPRCPVDAHGHEDMGFVTKNGRGVIHAEPQSIIYVLTFLSASRKKATAGLDDVEPKVLLRTIDSGSIPEFRGGLSEEQLPLCVGPVTSEISMSTDGTQYSSCTCRYTR